MQPPWRNRIIRGGRTGKHHCHWPGCDVLVPPASWGCRKHWYKLPGNLRTKIWHAYRPGQEDDKRPSDRYIEVAKEVQAWIAENHPADAAKAQGQLAVTPDDRRDHAWRTRVVRRQVLEGMLAAIKWRNRWHRKPERNPCQRCEGTGLIRTWGGRAGEGGRVGPCPKCRVEAAHQFVKGLASELFTPREWDHAAGRR